MKSQTAQAETGDEPVHFKAAVYLLCVLCSEAGTLQILGAACSQFEEGKTTTILSVRGFLD